MGGSSDGDLAPTAEPTTAASGGTLTAGQLARRAGSSAERIGRMSEVGILEPLADGTYRESDIHRARLVEALHSEGISVEALGEAISLGHLTFRWVDGTFPMAIGLLPKTYGELAAEVGLSLEGLGRLYTSWGFPPPLEHQLVREDDYRAVLAQKAFPDQGLNEDVVMAASRYFGENLRRISQTQVRFFVDTMIQPMLDEGMTVEQALEAAAPVSTALQPAGEELVRWLHSRHFEYYVVQETIQLVERALREAGLFQERPIQPPAVAFLLVSAYARLSREGGDLAAADFAGRLSEVVSAGAVRHDGRLVKMLADGAMLHFAEPADAVRCALELVESIDRAGLPPARVGINAGPMVFRDGDYFGQTVNGAAMTADYARPREVLVSERVAESVDADSVAFERIGPVTLRGLATPVDLSIATWRRPAAGSAPEDSTIGIQ